MDPESWLKQRAYTSERMASARLILEDLKMGKELHQAMRRHPLPGGGYVPKHLLVAVYRELVESGVWQADDRLLARIRMKPVRTLSGVTTVTVLTAPYPCPGKCIFCPTEDQMPKSYLPDEPGARRGLQHGFDPFAQTTSRMQALHAVGHPTEKIELLVLGGTFSSYRRDYQEWFIQRCFDAMNEGDPSTTLEEAQCRNETAVHRNVGLVIETRPDKITPAELAWLRRLGVTKVQIGAQSLDNEILEKNCRGHTTEETLRACQLLRQAGFKILLHWMPNLLGSTLDRDRIDFARLWQDYCPDELKIYPCQLLKNTQLFEFWQRGEYHPYQEKELVDLIASIKPSIPRYCRVNRVVRDIPSDNVVAGSKRTSLRQDVQEELVRRGERCHCIRCREVRSLQVTPDLLLLEDLVYHPQGAVEHFLSFVTPDDHLVGYIRLCLPERDITFTSEPDLYKDLADAALVREVHVYGQSLPVGVEKTGAAQHAGLGTRLLEEAEKIARTSGYKQIAVIAAIGTRAYYRQRGYDRGVYYMTKSLTAD
jgi:elongator complex protein 3